MDCRYPMKSLLGDYLRGGVGLAAACGLLAGATMLTAFQYILIAAALLFAGYVLRTWVRHRTVYALSEEGLRADGPFGRAVRWADLRDARLRYFAIRRDRKSGWLQLTLKTADAKLSVDSELDGFDAVLERAALAVRRNGLELSDPMAENFATAGFPVRPAAGEDAPAPRGAAEAP